MNIGIIGYGVVGRAVAAGFQNKCHLYIYDPAYTETDADEKNRTLCKSVSAVIENVTFIFICVPTPMQKSPPYAFDSSYMDTTLAAIAQAPALSKEHIPIIKSTVIPSKINEYIRNYPQFNIVVCPEFLTENNYIACFLKPAYRIYGGQTPYTNQVHQLFESYSDCEPCHIAYCDQTAASLIKYMINTFLAMKVGFMNQCYDLVQSSGTKTTWEQITEIFHYDTRTGNSHAAVPGPDGQRGWGGKCFPKDVHALINEANRQDDELSILQAVLSYNDTLRNDNK